MRYGARPPQALERLLMLFLERDRQETVTGDLLEEYRESLLPSIGRRRAGWWYGRQVFYRLWSLSAVFVAMSLAILIARELADWFLPVAIPGNYQARASALGWAIVSCHVWAGFITGWRTGRIIAGTLVSMFVAVCSWPIMPLLSGLLTASGVASSYSAVEIPRSASELVWMLPLIAGLILASTAFAGFSGALAGVAARRFRHRARV